MTDNAPDRIVTRHYANGIIAAQPAEKGFAFNGGNHTHAGEYIRADMYTAVCADNDALQTSNQMLSDELRDQMREREARTKRAEAAESERDALKAQLAEAAKKIDWCAGLLPSDDARDKAGAWAYDIRAFLEPARDHSEWNAAIEAAAGTADDWFYDPERDYAANPARIVLQEKPHD